MTAPAFDTRAASAPRLSILLIHGAFIDSSGWQPVRAQLVARGFDVKAVQYPTLTLEGDTTSTRRAIEAARYPVLLVGHSYGGPVITQAGDHPNVKGLVYVAAFVPDVGESVAQLNDASAEEGESKAPVLPPQDGYLVVDTEQFPDAFAADVDPATTRFMAAAQLPWGLDAATATITGAAWKTRPSIYLVALAYRMVPPSAQRCMAQRADAALSEIDSSHAAMLSHPQEVADFVTAAAATLA